MSDDSGHAEQEMEDFLHEELFGEQPRSVGEAVEERADELRSRRGSEEPVDRGRPDESPARPPEPSE